MSETGPTPENKLGSMYRLEYMSVNPLNCGNSPARSCFTPDTGTNSSSRFRPLASASSRQKLWYQLPYMWGYTSSWMPPAAWREPRLPPSTDFCSYSLTR